VDIDNYCRELEAHLCRRNGGHLVRIAGPSFETVCGWARQGIPLKVAMQGIDRHVDRAAARGPRRRPIPIVFCEADVLDAFDAWRRAVGVRPSSAAGVDETAAAGAAEHTEQAEARGGRRESLATHLDRAIVRLTALRAGGIAPAWGTALEATVCRLDALHPATRRARGEARDRILGELAALDAGLLVAARESGVTAGQLAAVHDEAVAELEPFRTRLAPEAFDAALRRCEDRLLRDSLKLPSIVPD
jgi:hypothetical protein